MARVALGSTARGITASATAEAEHSRSQVLARAARSQVADIACSTSEDTENCSEDVTRTPYIDGHFVTPKPTRMPSPSANGAAASYKRSRYLCSPVITNSAV